MIVHRLKKNKDIIGYGLLMALVFLVLEWFKFRFIVMEHRMEIYIGIIALIFTILGIWLSRKLTSQKVETIIVREIVVQTETNFMVNEDEISKRKISKRELEVLELVAKGLSNQEIATALFVSLHTVKSHVSNLFEKLDVKRRTQAIEKAKQLRLLPGTLV